MVFSSMIFIFVFLVLCYTCYIFGKTMKTRNIILLVSSLIFYAWGGPPLVLLLCLMTFICWAGAIIIDNQSNGKRKNLYCAIVTGLCLSLLFIFKYTVFLLTGFYDLFSISGFVPSITLPIGISFYTFQLISYVIDVKRGDVPAQKKYWLLLLYASLFHQCIAGPIVRYADVDYDINNRVMTPEETAKGFMRFATGLAKKAILANGCATIADRMLPQSFDSLSEQPAAAVLLGVFCFMLQIYLDFSAYSDMAIGMGLMIGFHYKENFNYPYIAQSVTDFWRRWHISLSTFFRDYVYIPLGGNRVSVPRHIFNLFVVWALTGFWHGASWNYLLWGIYYFVFLVIEKYLVKPKNSTSLHIRIPKTLLTLVIVFFGWMIFKFEDLSLLGVALKNLFNFANFTNLEVNTLFINNIFFLTVCCIACTPIIPAISKKLCVSQTGTRVNAVISAVTPALLIVLSGFMLAGDSYNPFLYFQF